MKFNCYVINYIGQVIHVINNFAQKTCNSDLIESNSNVIVNN